MQRIEEAYTLWSSGQALNAGQIIYPLIAVQSRPQWAVGILEQCLPLIPPVVEFEKVRSLAFDPVQWKDAHAAFYAVRQLTLQAEKASTPEPIYHVLLYLVENTAKVIYNASGESAPFDNSAGPWVVRCARDVVDKAAEPGLEEKVWSAVASTA